MRVSLYFDLVGKGDKVGQKRLNLFVSWLTRCAGRCHLLVAAGFVDMSVSFLCDKGADGMGLVDICPQQPKHKA